MLDKFQTDSARISENNDAPFVTTTWPAQWVLPVSVGVGLLDSFHGVPFNVTVLGVGNSTLDYYRGRDRTLEPSVQYDSVARRAELARIAPIKTQYEHTC